MDPERIHAYLQAACAGLGFDIGEVWFSPTSETSNSSRPQVNPNKFKFLQLYTSRSYISRRDDLLRPDLEHLEECENVQKHVLSPKLVNVISTTSQVVWAHCPKQEGLLGRSDMRLQTAVGMPVAMDSDGNMCIVVMFSPKNMQKNDDALEYLRFFRQSASSPSSIPCLLPVVDRSQNKLVYNPKRFIEWKEPHLQKETDTSCHELSSAPKDPYGIPKLPSTAELNSLNEPERKSSIDSAETASAFDLVTYGVWSTIMNLPTGDEDAPYSNSTESQLLSNSTSTSTSSSSPFGTSSVLTNHSKHIFQPERRERLEEFISAFLGMSTFDLADIWIPVSNEGRTKLHHVCSISETDGNMTLNNLKNTSRDCSIETWSGAIGRAYASGNPLWGTNRDMVFDIERYEILSRSEINTVLSVPIFSPGNVSPSGVLCCYSFVHSDHVSFVLKFLQQALRTLWTGLDNVEPEPNSKIDRKTWKRVGPADLGEMAADLEMQTAFYKKKRTRQDLIQDEYIPVDDYRIRSSSLSMQLQALNMPPGESSTPVEPKVAAVKTDDTHPKPMNRSLSSDRLLKRAHMEQSNFAFLHPGMSTQRVEGPSFFSSGQQSFEVGKQLANLPLAESCAPSPHTSIPKAAVPSDNNAQLTEAMGYINAFNALVKMSQQQSQTEAQPDTNSINTMNQPFNIGVNAPVFPSSTASSTVTAQPTITPLATNSTPTNAVLPDVTHSSTVTPFYSTIQSNSFSAVNPALGNFCAPISSEASSSSTLPPKPSGNVCRIEGCNDLTVTRRPYCLRHSGNRLCEHPSCSKCAQGATRFCIAHGGGRRCTFPNCDKGARDKFFCAAHGGGKRCKSKGCTKSAVGGSQLCTSHGGGRRCAIEGCMKSAQSSTKFCVKHGGGKKCSHPNCGKVARGRTLFCAGHGGGVRCKLDGCSRIAIGKMQLCRAHGGGSKKTKSLLNSNNQEAKSPPISPPISPPPPYSPGMINNTSAQPSAVSSISHQTSASNTSSGISI